jgi:uncharacterized membrane protein
MPFYSRLLRIELIAQVALVACALLFAGVLALLAALSAAPPGVEFRDLAAVPSLAAVTYTHGVLPVAIVGAPLYAALEAHRRATVATAILVGLVPGLIALIVWATGPSIVLGPTILTPVYGALYLACGISVALATHLLRTRGRGPDLAPPNQRLERP